MTRGDFRGALEGGGVPQQATNTRRAGLLLECPGECVCAHAAVCVSVIAPAECDQLVSECAFVCFGCQHCNRTNDNMAAKSEKISFLYERNFVGLIFVFFSFFLLLMSAKANVSTYQCQTQRMRRCPSEYLAE